MERAKITINKKDFSIKIDMEGYEGQECLHDIESLQALLSATTTDETIKPEYQHTLEVGHASIHH